MEKVLQDRYHVGHSISPAFNNSHPLFWAVTIKSLRDLTTNPDPLLEGKIDTALRQGQIAKKVLGQRSSTR